MGWTGTTLQPGETVRSLVIRAYEGDPLGCASCGWHQESHPRVRFSEYDALYGPSDRAPDEPHDFEPRTPTYRVMDYARSGGTAYLAVQTIATGEVWAGVCMVNQGGGQVTYKEMEESMGPVAECPARILALLTPTDDEYRNKWRAECRAYLARQAAKPKLRPGMLVRFAEPLTFSNGDELSELVFENGSTFRHPEYRSLRYRVGGLRNRDYSLVDGAQTDRRAE
ncbi:MAG: hypothetical protein C0498_01245 [Anaerolinea sp.]|nr:hypothetical protein [Anaerolinea sp.]